MNEQERSKNFKVVLLEWIDDDIDCGLSLTQAAENAVGRLVRTGFAVEALKAIGPQILADFWRQARGSERRAAIARNSSRRLRLAVLNSEESLLDVLVALGGGVWKPWGELTKAECLQIAGNYAMLERGVRAWRKGWTELGRSLKRDETVRQRFTDEQLRGLFREHLAKGQAAPLVAATV